MKNRKSRLDWTSPQMQKGVDRIFDLVWEGAGERTLPILLPKDWMERWVLAVALSEMSMKLIEPMLEDIRLSCGRRP